jgi:isochorismate hydrolase
MAGSKRPLDSKKCALLIVDMQKFFITQAKHIAPRLAELGRFCLGKRIPVVLTAHHDKPEETTELIKWWGENGRLEKGTDVWELMDEIQTLQEENGVIMLDEKTA